jgi:PAS domain S-box-containing protein
LIMNVKFDRLTVGKRLLENLGCGIVSQMRHPLAGRLRYLAALWVAGALALAFATWICLRLGLSSATTACIYLIIIVLLSLMDSFLSSALFCFIAVICLDYYFTAPLYTFEIADAQDLITLTAFLLTSLVITSLVRRLRNLGQAHREQARLLDLTRDSVLVRNTADLITFWNRGSEELYGWTSQEAIGKVTHALLHTVFPEPLEQITSFLLLHGHWEGELLHRRKDGTQIIATSRWSLQRDEAGSPSATLETNTDITERKRTEEALRQTQETYLAEAQRLSHTGSFGWTPVTGEIFLSEEGLRILGIDATIKPSIQSLLARIHPDDRALVEQHLERAIRASKSFDFEHRVRLPDGTEKQVQIVGHPIGKQDNNKEYAGALMDVSAIRSAELDVHKTRAELAHVMRVSSLGELTASIAHEVNQPLGAVVTNAQACMRWLDRANPDLNQAHAALDRIVRDGHRAGEVVQRIRALAKKTEIQKAPVQLNEVISESLSVVQHELLIHKVRLQLELASDLPLVFADSIQLQQVFINLSMNAIEAMHAMESPKDLVVRSQRNEAGHIYVTVTDTGVGFSDDTAEKLFDAFFTTKSSGLGMGLSICRSIIEAHGGRISSTPNLVGATVHVTLPPYQETQP